MPDAPLRIAAVSLHTSPLAEPGGDDAGGMNVVILEQSRALARAGHRVDVFTRRSDPRAPAVIEAADGVRVHHLDAGPPAPLAKSAMEQAIDPFRTQLRRAMNENRADADDAPWDLIHSHHWFSGVAALPLAGELGIPRLQSFHSVAAPEDSAQLDAGEPAESSGRIPGERLAAQRSDLVVAVSEAEARTVAERYGVPGERLTVVRPGVDVVGFHPGSPGAVRAPGTGTAHPGDRSPGTPRTLLFAARLQPLKAPDLAIEVLARLDPALEARLILTGGVSEDFRHYLGELQSTADELGVAHRVEFVGPRSRVDLARVMREADLLLLTSWSETFGLVALEAQASGTPVAAWSGAGGVREAIAPAGIVLPSRDPDVWAEAVQSLLSDRQAHETAAREARRFAESRTWEASAQVLAAQYACLVRPGGAPA